MDRFLILDGQNLLFQMFFGMPARIPGKDGRPIHGTLGFLGAMLRMVRLVQPTHLLVLFDREQPNLRAELDPDYKANRTDYSQLPEEETPFSQLPDLYKALDFLQIAHTEVQNAEADDVIASYAKTYASQAEIYILSFDSDFFQLISDRVSVLRYRGEHTVCWTPETVREKFGILPEQYADFKSLTGDISDNIRGVDGIGPKTAACLLNEFGSLNSLLAHADQIRKPSVRRSVLQNTERLQRNQRLIRLENSVPLPFPLSALHFHYNGITTNEVLTQTGIK